MMNREQSRVNMDKKATIDYYNKNAEEFAAGTAYVDFHEMQDRFLSLLQPGQSVLDFGCGSGRDTKYFIDRGMSVDAVDGSEKLVRIAGEYAGVDVRQMLFQELDVYDEYDGIWACASILHLPKDELHNVLIKMADALKEKGIIYTSFKYGDFEGLRNGRYFTYFTEENFRSFIADIKQLYIEDIWITGDVRAGRGEERWLNLIIRKI